MTTTALLPAGISKFDIELWENPHQNFKHTFKRNASFKLTTPDPAGTNSQNYKATTKNFQWLIRFALDNNIQLRAMGSGWSFSEVAVCNGGVVDTKSLCLNFLMGPSFVSPLYIKSGKDSGNLFFVECGMSVLRINEILEGELNPKKSLRASGASNGQSIAGCTSTGTHGSAFDVGAVHDTIVGLHMIVGPDRHVWIERKSNPVASPEFIKWLDAELISDDDVFNAALVSFGSFGFIHGILLETEPVFLLEKHISNKVSYDEAAKIAITDLDFSKLATTLPYPAGEPGKELYHFEVIVNPHLFEPDNQEKGIYLRTMYKIAYNAAHTKVEVNDHGFTYGENTLGFIQTIIDRLGANLSAKLVPALVSKLMPLAFTVDEKMVGTIGETFNNTRFRGKVASTSIAVDSKDADRVIREIVAANKQNPFPGVLGLRYAKGTLALLGFTRFKKTCVMELDGVDSDTTRKFYENIWQRLEDLGITYTLHWGKINTFLNAARVRKMYGDETVNKWISIRHQLLTEPVRNIFTNGFMDTCGLSG